MIVGFRRKAREVQYCVQKDAYEGRLIDREGCKGGDEVDVTGMGACSGWDMSIREGKGRKEVEGAVGQVSVM